MVEVEIGMRESGEFPSASGNSLHVIQPVCLMMESGFLKDCPPSPHDNKDLFKTAINKPRACEEHTPWIHGFTPREHYDMLLNKELLAQQAAESKSDREWRDQQANKQREWQDKKDTEDRVWRESQARSSFRWHVAELCVIALLVPAVTLAAAILQRPDVVQLPKIGGTQQKQAEFTD